jgi:hypothetical protein
MVDLKPTPLGLSDDQFVLLTNTSAQLHQMDRGPFLRAVADRFVGKSEIGDGEFARGLRDLLQTGRFKWVLNTYHAARYA